MIVVAGEVVGSSDRRGFSEYKVPFPRPKTTPTTTHVASIIRMAAILRRSDILDFFWADAESPCLLSSLA